MAMGMAGFLTDKPDLKLGAMFMRDVTLNFIVNPRGAASAADIEGLIGHAREAVRSRFGVELAAEVRIVGDRKESRP